MLISFRLQERDLGREVHTISDGNGLLKGFLESEKAQTLICRWNSQCSWRTETWTPWAAKKSSGNFLPFCLNHLFNWVKLQHFL
jgi:hypothetical protein